MPPPSGPCATAAGTPTFSADTVLVRRLREVEVHESDTGLPSLTFASWSDMFVAADLTPEWETVALRTKASVRVIDENGGVWSHGSPVEDHRRTRREILSWLLDRREDRELPTLATWGNRSNWERPEPRS